MLSLAKPLRLSWEYQGNVRAEALQVLTCVHQLQVPAQQTASAAAIPGEAEKQKQQAAGVPVRPVFSMTASSRQKDRRQ